MRNRLNTPRASHTALGLAASLVVLSTGLSAFGQATPLPESIPIGSWTFRPSFELRLRGEYRRAPFDSGGVLFSQSAIFADDYGSNLPPRALTTFQPPPISDSFAITERARLGLAVDRGPVTASLLFQQAAPFAADPGFAALGDGTYGLGGISFYEAFIDVHGKNRRVWARMGRQRIVWGSGRLLGESDFSQTPRALNAIRLGFSFKTVDVEMFGAMLSMPLFGGLGALAGSASPAAASTSPVEPTTARTGSQLYGVRASWHLMPLLTAELSGLARVARTPSAGDLTPSDTIVLDARLSGDKRGFRYDVEGAYEIGRIASYGANRDLRAYAFAGRANWETALPAHLTFGIEGAYASGDNGSTDSLATQTRFDPILPETRPQHGRMGLYAWSNLMTLGVDIAARPTDTLSIDLGYHLVGLADPRGRWSSASLLPIGASPTNTSRLLGHQIDATIGVNLWDPLKLEAGYGLFLTGDGAKNILDSSGRGRPDMQHYGYLQATLHAP